MKITVERDGLETVVFQNVTDAYLCVRTLEPMQKKAKLAVISETRSYSWGANVRELVKEVNQSLYELQDLLRGGKGADNRSN